MSARDRSRAATDRREAVRALTPLSLALSEIQAEQVLHTTLSTETERGRRQLREEAEALRRVEPAADEP